MYVGARTYDSDSLLLIRDDMEHRHQGTVTIKGESLPLFISAVSGLQKDSLFAFNLISRAQLAIYKEEAGEDINAPFIVARQLLNNCHVYVLLFGAECYYAGSSVSVQQALKCRKAKRLPHCPLLPLIAVPSVKKDYAHGIYQKMCTINEIFGKFAPEGIYGEASSDAVGKYYISYFSKFGIMYNILVRDYSVAHRDCTVAAGADGTGGIIKPIPGAPKKLTMGMYTALGIAGLACPDPTVACKLKTYVNHVLSSVSNDLTWVSFAKAVMHFIIVHCTLYPGTLCGVVCCVCEGVVVL
jgi:hypothetical protein